MRNAFTITTCSEMASLLNASRRTLRRMVRDGTIPSPIRSSLGKAVGWEPTGADRVKLIVRKLQRRYPKDTLRAAATKHRRGE